MSLKFKLTSIICVMIAIVMAVLSIITLNRSGKMQTETTYQFAEELAERNAIEVQRRFEKFLNYGEVLAQVFNDYESTDEGLRRHTYDDLLRGTIQQHTRIMGIFTAWLPDTIDSYDARMGQYQTFFTRRRTGNVERIPAGYDGWQDYLANMSAVGKPVLETPVWRDIFGHGNVPVISVQYPIKNSQGSVVGVIGINWVSTMQSIVDELVQEIYDGKGVAGVFANDSTIVAHFDESRLKDTVAENTAEKRMLGEMHSRVIQAIKNGGENGKAVTLNRYSPALNTDIRLIYQPIRVEGIDTPWCLMMAIPMNEINRPLNEMIAFMALFAVVMLAAVLVITFFVARSIARPITAVALTLKDISEGEGDLTKRITTNSKDEVGDLSRYFNETLDKIRNLVIKIKQESVTLYDIGTNLASNMTETAAAINEITSNIQSIKGRVMNQSASVSETHATMEQVTVNIDKLNRHVEAQSVNVSRASSAIEEMAANIHSVTETLVNNSVNVTTMKEASEMGRTGLQNVAADIQEIARESEGLMQINSVMENIASQTNLLSMNAAIEAAHAGDAGKGFAVVADEIRKLAESSSEQSKTIGMVLKKIKGSIDKITQSTGNVLNRFEAIDTSVKIVAEQEDNIRNAMEEQEQGSKQILDGIVEVTGITRQVKSGSNEMLEGAKEVIQESNNLEKATQEITFGMNEMATGAEQINVAVNQVNELSGKNREGIDSLIREVSRFKVE
ncbi:MAG: methyl-accepting chemotaxis protein [Treponema sp.]|nr:methyl-accepting chemotaxis protein [Treponema sp.]